MGGHLQSRGGEQPCVIEARGVCKGFRVPSHRIDSLKERAVHPLTRVAYRQLDALRDVSLEVRRGEFFGIVGRNGSGKSTLLKLLASIYRADAGTIRVAGRLAPFIELGVGLNPELTARENVVLNGVMMGLSRREARRRLGAVLDFAELDEFADMKLKNYSSGMIVRLAFSVMIQSDADVLLIDEVLAVGDASFQQKCADVFAEMHGHRTIVLVTHDMGSVQRYCHRAMVLEHGRRVFIGDPEEAGREYLRINFDQDHQAQSYGDRPIVPDLHTRAIDAWLETAGGERITNVAQGEPIRLRAVLEASVDLADPYFNLLGVDAGGVTVFEHMPRFAPAEGKPRLLRAGQRMLISGEIDNPLAPGRYKLSCWVSRAGELGDLALQAVALLDFVVYGSDAVSAKVALPGDVSVVPQGPEA